MASDSAHVNDVRVEYIRSRRPPSSINGTPIRAPPNADDNDLDSDTGSYVFILVLSLINASNLKLLSNSLLEVKLAICSGSKFH